MVVTSPGWVRPANPTRADRARIEGTIASHEESARFYERNKRATAALVAQAHADEWRKRLASLT